MNSKESLKRGCEMLRRLMGVLVILGAVAGVWIGGPPAFAGDVQCGPFDDFTGNCICYIIGDDGKIKGWIRYPCD
jgi:hypothetical protein